MQSRATDVCSVLLLVDSKGMTLYIFDKDKEAGKSTCYGGCAKAWPLFAPEADDPSPMAPLSIITRDEGTKQFAYRGKPLYYYKKRHQSRRH